MNPVHNAFDLWELTELYLEVHGSAYWLLDRDPLAQLPARIWILPSHLVTPRRDPGSRSIIDHYEYRSQAVERIAPERIHIERFGVPDDGLGGAKHEVQPGDADDATVAIVRDGLTREIRFKKSDPSILDAAGAAGLELPFSCKSGLCCTCRAKLMEGKVRMYRNFALEPHEVAAGFVLTCQSHPLTQRVLLSFDER